MTPLARVCVIVCSIVLAGCASKNIPVSEAAASSTTPPVVGIWYGVDEYGKEGTLILESNSAADLIKDGKSARDTLVRGRGTISYDYNPDTDPDTLDLVLTLNSGAVKRLPGTLTFISPDTIEVTMFDDKITLHRQKNPTLGELDQ